MSMCSEESSQALSMCSAQALSMCSEVSQHIPTHSPPIAPIELRTRKQFKVHLSQRNSWNKLTPSPYPSPMASPEETPNASPISRSILKVQNPSEVQSPGVGSEVQSSGVRSEVQSPGVGPK